ncbi:hypothetical protein Nepgr_003171 [Nepenthes gracilis]|uniref:C2H2-type domain-containing protein n=1 Tax=Nepenthes gracilis TaxID=150966 RepID=A0AAD3XD39_NEPGR|nr:hypothetical protein Nepgr_003171 [Nepenthes gracilis]
MACEILSEALSFAEANKLWKFWACCCCGERFPDVISHMQHVMQEHMGKILPKMQSVLPQNVDSELVEMLLSCSWKPLDLAASVRLLEDQSKSKDPAFGDKCFEGNHKEQSKVCGNDSFCFEDAWGSFPEKENMLDGCNGCSSECEVHDKGLSSEFIECHRNPGSKVYNLPNGWPLSDDNSEEKIMLSQDASCLILDENSLPSYAFGNNIASATSAVGSEKGVQSCSGSLLSWTYAGPLTGEQLAIWLRMRKGKAQQGIEYLQMLGKECDHL